MFHGPKMSLNVFVLGERYVQPVPIGNSPFAIVKAIISEFSLSVKPSQVILRKVDGSITPGNAQALFDSAGVESEIIDGRSLPTGGDNIVATIVPTAGAYSH